MARELPQEPSILQEMVVGRRNIGKVIGPGGEVAASIRKATRCQLHVVPHVNRQDDTQIVEISGTAQQVINFLHCFLETTFPCMLCIPTSHLPQQWCAV
jgi:hypothetical protein